MFSRDYLAVHRQRQGLAHAHVLECLWPRLGEVERIVVIAEAREADRLARMFLLQPRKLAGGHFGPIKLAGKPAGQGGVLVVDDKGHGLFEDDPFRASQYIGFLSRTERSFGMCSVNT